MEPMEALTAQTGDSHILSRIAQCFCLNQATTQTFWLGSSFSTFRDAPHAIPLEQPFSSS